MKITLAKAVEAVKAVFPSVSVISVPAQNGVAVFSRCDDKECKSTETRWSDFSSGTPICPECGCDLNLSHWEIVL